jgi:hypothetical protein
MLWVYALVKDVHRQMKIIDEVSVSGVSPTGQELTERELCVLDGMYYAYSRIFAMLKDELKL